MDSKFDYGTGTLAVYLDGVLQIKPVIFTINAQQDWVGNIKGILGSNTKTSISGGVRKLRINLRRNFTGNINLVRSGDEPAGIGSDINLGDGHAGVTFKGNLDLSTRGTTVNINGANYNNYQFEGQIILGGTEYASTTINATNVDFFLTRANDDPNTLINITGGTNKFNFKESVNIYGNIYTTGGTNTFTSNDSTKFYMAGDINAKGGTNVFVFKNASITPVLAGNINVSGGSTSIIFDNTAWLSASYKQNYALKSTYGDKFLNIKNGEDKSDEINTFSTLTGNLNITGGNANVVFHYNQKQSGAEPITHNVMVSNKGNANILLDTNLTNHSPFTFITNLMYAGVNSAGQYIWTGAGNGNAINLIFARGHSGNYGSNNTVSFNSTNQTFLGATLTNGLRFEFKDKNIAKGSSNASFIAAYKDAILAKVNQGGHKTDLLSVKFETGKEATSNNRIGTITLTGVAVGNIYALSNQTSAYNLVVDNNSALFAQIDQSAANKLNMQLKEGSKLILDNSTSINKLETQNNTIIDVASVGNDLGSIPTRTNFKLLQIGSTPTGTNTGLKGGNALFRVYMNAGANQTNATLGDQKEQANYGYLYSDRIIVHHLLANGGSDKQASTPLTEYIQVLTNPDNNVTGIRYHGGGTEVAGNVAVLTVKNLDNGQAGINLQSTSAIAGFDELSSTLTAVKTDQTGKSTGSNGYTTYFLDSLSSGITAEDRSASMSALSSGHNVFMANLNSLNKRMGELRDNANGNGLWARITNGMQSNYYNQNTSTVYTNIQAGFDHAFGGNGSNNYTGFALSYVNGVSFSKDMTRKDGSLAGLDSGVSNGFEIALYNSYVNDGARSNRWDKGFYNDNVLKFSAIFSSANMLNGSSDSYTNLGISFSEEIGYRFLLGKNNNWYIDPQAEVAIGYLTGSKVNQVSGSYYLKGTLDSISVLRGRVGSSFGYYFDQFTKDKDFKSKLYLGLFYEGDLVSGANVALSSNLSSINYAITSTSRMLLNIGTNFTIKDNHRIYFDFQRSFFGKIVTDYQLNLGYRYSFGTSKYTPLENINTAEASNDSKIKEVAPTKGYYIKLLDATKPSKKQNRILSKIEDLKTQNIGDSKSYLIGPFRSIDEAKGEVNNYEGVLKELKSDVRRVNIVLIHSFNDFVSR